MVNLLPARVSAVVRRVGGDNRAAIVLGLATLLGPLGGFLANLVYARTLGPSGRGELAAVVAALALCEVVLVFGFPDVLTRHVARKMLSGYSFRSTMRVAMLGSLLPGAMVVWWAHSRGFGWTSSIAAGVVVPIASLASMGRGILAGHRSFGRLAYTLLAGGIVRIVAPLILILADTDSPDLALILVAASTMIASVPVFLSRPFRWPEWDSTYRFRSVAREALSLWPASLAWSLNSRLDQILLAVLVTSYELGLYAVCVAMAELPVALASGVRQVILVRVSESGSLGRVYQASILAIIIGAICAVFSWWLGGAALGWVFGPDFASVANVLAILLIASSLIIASGFVNTVLIAFGLGRLTVISQGVGLIFSVALLLIVVPKGGGILGAAFVNLITYFGVFVVSSVILYRVNGSMKERAA